MMMSMFIISCVSLCVVWMEIEVIMIYTLCTLTARCCTHSAVYLYMKHSTPWVEWNEVDWTQNEILLCVIPTAIIIGLVLSRLALAGSVAQCKIHTNDYREPHTTRTQSHMSHISTRVLSLSQQSSHVRAKNMESRVFRESRMLISNLSILR